jgi:hypothetical protein
MKQQTLSGFEKYGKTTRRGKFLADMDRIIPWPEMTGAVATLNRLEMTAALTNLYIVRRQLLAV